jgi:hypothetical protein
MKELLATVGVLPVKALVVGVMAAAGASMAMGFVVVVLLATVDKTVLVVEVVFVVALAHMAVTSGASEA